MGETEQTTQKKTDGHQFKPHFAPVILYPVQQLQRHFTV